jgi:hypothetical protein
MNTKMADKNTKIINESRRMRNRNFINIIVKGYEVWHNRKRVQGGQDRTRMGFKTGNQTIIRNIVKRDRGKRTAVHKIHINKEKVSLI